MDEMKQELLKSMRIGIIYMNIRALLACVFGIVILAVFIFPFIVREIDEMGALAVALVIGLILLLVGFLSAMADIIRYKKVKAGIEDESLRLCKGQVEKYYVHMPTTRGNAYFEWASLDIDGVAYFTDKYSAYHCQKGDWVIYVTGFVWQDKVTSPVVKIKTK